MQLFGKSDETSSKSILRDVLRVALISALILLIPLTAKIFASGMEWSAGDFFAAWMLFFATGFTYKLVTRNMKNTKYRVAAGIAVLGGLMLIWINLAVGIIGSEDNPANMMYVGVLAIGTIAALITRFRPKGMSFALYATALAQAAAGAIAIIFGLGYPENSAVQLLFLNGFFVTLFAVSGVLFGDAAKANAGRVIQSVK